jgi:hypothetical protein
MMPKDDLVSEVTDAAIRLLAVLGWRKLPGERWLVNEFPQNAD